MAKTREATNPFYVLLVILGVIFFVTACAYGVMALQGIKGAAPPALDSSGAGLLDFMDQHGEALMLAELVLLAIATFGAMATDQYWQRRTDQRRDEQSNEKGGSTPADRPQ